MSAVRVYIVDDHELVRYGLKMAIEADGEMEVVGEAECGEAALAGVAEADPDLLLLDLRMPGMGGVEACRRLTEEHPGIRVVVLTSYDDDDEIFGVLSAGAVGYLMKDSSPESLLQALKGVVDGQTVLDSAVARRVIDAGGSGPAPTPATQLSDREMDVLRLMAKGLNNRRIARELWISEPTVKSHVSHILHKLKAADRTAAVVEGIRLGVLTVPGGDATGATAAEYAIMVSLIAVAIIGAVALFGSAVLDLFVQTSNAVLSVM